MEVQWAVYSSPFRTRSHTHSSLFSKTDPTAWRWRVGEGSGNNRMQIYWRPGDGAHSAVARSSRSVALWDPDFFENVSQSRYVKFTIPHQRSLSLIFCKSLNVIADANADLRRDLITNGFMEVNRE